MTSRVLGIPTADCGLVAFSDGELAYITKRFDRISSERKSEKLHQEDLAQGFNLLSGGKYDKSYEAAGKLIAEMTNGKLSVVLDFIQRVIHAYLIGNDDMHLKNISLQRLTHSSSRFYDKLTPNYDCLFVDAFDNTSSHNYLALDLLEGDFSEYYQRYGYYTGYDFIELSNRLGVRDVSVKKFIGSIDKKKDELISTILHSYMPTTMKEKAENLINTRLKALLTGVN